MRQNTGETLAATDEDLSLCAEWRSPGNNRGTPVYPQQPQFICDPQLCSLHNPKTSFAAALTDVSENTHSGFKLKILNYFPHKSTFQTFSEIKKKVHLLPTAPYQLQAVSMMQSQTSTWSCAWGNAACTVLVHATAAASLHIASNTLQLTFTVASNISTSVPLECEERQGTGTLAYTCNPSIQMAEVPSSLGQHKSS